MNLAEKWIVSAGLAKQLLSGGATLLDARLPVLKWFGRLPQAVPVTWQEFSRSHFPQKGKILENNSPLGSLARLVRLELDNNRISDISPLASLTNLFPYLVLHNNQIVDISPLASLTQSENISQILRLLS
jgi:Leucine-rich repeat (LRR) protein